MNFNRMISVVIIVLLILGMLFTSQSATTVIAKDRDGKLNTSISIESDTKVLGQAELHLEGVLDEIDDEDGVKDQLYSIARNAHSIALRTAFYLGIDMSPGIDRGNIAFDAQDDFELNIATNGDISKLNTMNNVLGKYDDRLKDLLSGASPSELQGDGPAEKELQEIHEQAASISKAALLQLGFDTFFYGPVLDCEPHSPIVIYSNEEFTPANGVVNGTGTQADPYMISGWEIDTSSAVGIDIRNTDANFIIRNVCIYDSGAQSLIDNNGIFMLGVENGAVETSSIHDNNIGVYFRDSPGIRIGGNFITRNDDHGIFALESPNSIIVGNRLTLNGDSTSAILVRLSDHSIVSDNEIMMNGIGLSVDESHYVTVTFNNITSNDETGISLARSEHNTVSNCKIANNNNNGISLLLSSHVDLNNNIIHMNGKIGISIGDDNLYIDVEGNIITENGGLASAGSGIGISMTHSSFIDVINNRIERNEGQGIGIGDSSSSVYIIGNEINSNIGATVAAGISVAGSSGILIKCNNITGQHPDAPVIVVMDYVGVDLGHTASGVTVVHNNFINDAMEGLDRSGVNTWDMGYPGGGNHWSKKTGSDTRSGPDQDIDGSDGIMDGAYKFDFYDSNNEDHYPFAAPVDINECMKPWVNAQFITMFLGKLYRSSITLARANESLMSTYASILNTVTDTEAALVNMRQDAGMIVTRITEVLDDGYPCKLRVTPGGPDNDVGSGHKFQNSQNKYTTDAPANKLEAYTKTVINIDQRLTAALDEIGAAPDQPTADALMEMRQQANTIVVLITQQLEDDYPYS